MAKLDSKKVWCVIISHPNSGQTLETNYYDNEKEALKDARSAVNDMYEVNVYHNNQNIAYSNGENKLERPYRNRS